MGFGIMKREKTTVNDCCPKNCAYRCFLDSGVFYCNYIGITGHSRGCEVKDCDKMIKGKRRVKAWTDNLTEHTITHEIEIDGKVQKVVETPTRRLQGKKFGRVSTYAEEQTKKTLALVPKIKTTL